MKTELIREQLSNFWLKLQYYFKQAVDFARQLIDDPTIVSRSDLIMIGAAALIVVLLVLGGLIRFFTEPWKRKGQSLLMSLVILLALAFGLFLIVWNLPMP